MAAKIDTIRFDLESEKPASLLVGYREDHDGFSEHSYRDILPDLSPIERSAVQVIYQKLAERLERSLADSKVSQRPVGS